MSCCIRRFDSPEERRALVNLPTIRTWRLLTGGELREWFKVHDVCFDCKGAGERIIGWRGTTIPITGLCEKCSGTGYWRE